MKLAAIIIIILLIGGFMVYQANNTDLREVEDRKTFVVAFGGWIKDVALNTKNIVTYSIKQDWTPENKTKLN